MRPTGIVPADASNQPKPISPGKSTDRATLAAIARQAMIVRGLEPDFPLAAQQELAAIVGPAKATENIRDLRDRLWASIDNDNSRELEIRTFESAAFSTVGPWLCGPPVRADNGISSALATFQSRLIVGALRPSSIWPSIARLTPEICARRSSEYPRRERSSRRLWPTHTAAASKHSTTSPA